ncbi:hypothetical protein [Brenneria corticis]|uniref:hypothetical protein n=1 Tax=Brenneria corticis TaxID=2173106 RepID=UPI001FEFA208|nr:hypothetical protein [Brenneria sp. CFCC 11842]
MGFTGDFYFCEPWQSIKVSAEQLLESRGRLLARVAGWLDEPSNAFLFSVENEKPDFGIIGFPHACELPGVRRKLHNLAQRSAAKRQADHQKLEQVLDQIADQVG